MMFLVRSTFWLGIVVSNMPFDGAQALRGVDQARSVAIKSVANIAEAKCAQESASCRLALAAAGVGLPPGAAPLRAARSALAAGSGKGKSPSANSLTAADVAPPWRGPSIKSGA